MKLRSTIAIMVMAAVPDLALAQTASTPRIDKRQELQQQRIDRGAQSGALNEKEGARLEKGQERVQKVEDKAVADGKVTAKERARIEHRQDQQSRRIYGEKHDRQQAGQDERRGGKRQSRR